MDTYLEEFKLEMLENEKAMNTIKTYESDILQFLEHTCKDILKTDKADILKFKISMRAEGYKAYTINRKLTAINQYIKFLNFHPDINLNIAFKKEKIQKQEYLQEMITITDYRKLVGAAERAEDLRAVALFKTMYLTGMRVSETLQYKVKDVGKKKITVLGKGNKERRIIIPDDLNQCLNKYLEARSATSDLLFTCRNGPISRQTVHYIIKKYAGRSKVKLSRAHAHNFRHLFAIICIRERGLTIDEVADFLGHVDINTTRIYTRKTEDELMKIAEKFE